MTRIDRRRMLGFLLGGAAVAPIGVGLVAQRAEAAAASAGISATKRAAKPDTRESEIEKTAAVVTTRRRVRRKVCVTTTAGRRTCTWRWVWI